jgi:Ca2+-binding EF-hand superfamily protein
LQRAAFPYGGCTRQRDERQMSNDRPRKIGPQKLKKSETLEVRIPFETKQAFLTACREDGTTASEVVRESVQSYLDGRVQPVSQPERTLLMNLPQPVRRYAPRAAAGAIAAIGLATFAALPSAAAPDFAAIFKRMDANGDGLLSADEFLADRQGGEHVRIESRIEKTTKGEEPSTVTNDGKTEIKQDAYAFWLPDDGAPGGQQVNAIHRQEVRIERRSDSSGAPPSPPAQVNVMESEFKSFDTDGNGKVSLAEFQLRHRAMLTRGFELLDSNKDGSLTPIEYAQIANPPMPQIAGDPPIPAPPIPPGGPALTPEKLQASFAKLDANKDNKLSLQEYLPPA